MRLRKLIGKNKRGINYYSPLIAIMGIFILGAILSNLFVKQYKLSSDFDLGREQFRILLTESSAEKALLFVDNAARLALEQAAFSYGKGGLFTSAHQCGSSGSVNYWTKDEITPQNDCQPQTKSDKDGVVGCFPDETVMQGTLSFFFTQKLSSFITNFNAAIPDSSIKIPFNYQPFTPSPVAGRTEFVGISNEPITITAPQLKYYVKPNFRASILVDVIASGADVVAKGRQLPRLSGAATKEKVKGFNSAGKLKWNLDSYTKAQSACTYNTGISCQYVCGQTCSTSQVCTPGEGANAQPSCSDVTTCVPVYCDGTYKRTVSYNEFSSLVSASESAKVLVNNPATNKPEFKNPEYDFGLSWIETMGSSDACSP